MKKKEQDNIKKSDPRTNPFYYSESNKLKLSSNMHLCERCNKRCANKHTKCLRCRQELGESN